MQEQDDQHLDDIIKSSFEKRSKGAPDGLWRNLSSALDADQVGSAEQQFPLDPLDKKVKESFSSLNERAPGHVWPAINRQLNIDKVWQGISKELGKTHPLYSPGMRRMAAAMLLLLLSGAGAYVMLDYSSVDQPLVHAPESTAAEEKESAVIGESTIDLGLAEKTQQRQQANASNAAAGKKPVFSVNENSLDKRLVSGERNESKLTSGTLKELPAAVQDIDSLLISKEAIAEANNISGQGYTKEVSGMNKGSEAKDLAGVAVTESKAKAVHASSEVESLAKAALQEQISLNTLIGSRNEKTVVEKGSLSAATKASDDEAAPAGKETKAALASAEHVLRGSEDTQEAFFVAPRLVDGIPFTLELNKGVVDVLILPVDTVALYQEEIFAQLMEEQAEKQLNKRRFEAGPVMVYHNSWLLNNETKSSYDKSSLIATDPTYKQNWGLVLNYYLGRKSLIASEAHISRVGQQYKMYQQGEYLEKGLELRYYKLYLQYQHNFLEYGKTLPSWLTVKAGAYGGYLYEKRGELRTEESKYDNIDYGVKLALGQETDLGRFILGYGVSAERGFNNVFKGTERLPAEFNKTYLLNFGSYINLRYSF